MGDFKMMAEVQDRYETGKQLQNKVIMSEVSKASVQTKIDREILRDLLSVLKVNMTLEWNETNSRSISRSAALEILMRNYFSQNNAVISQIDQIVKRRQNIK